MEACRACMNLDPHMVKMDEEFVNAYNLLTNLNVTLFDAMPHYVCNRCVEDVKYCSDFRERCITTETSLQEMLQKVEPNETKLKNPKVENIVDQMNNGIKIKLEIKDEKENDDYDNYYEDTHAEYDDDVILSLLKSEITEDVKPKKRKYTKRVTLKEKVAKEIVPDKFSCDVKPKRKKYGKRLTLQEKIERGIIIDKFNCGLCASVFNDREELKTHVESHKDMRQCLLCKEKAYSWPNLVAHRITHLKQKEPRCHMCKKKIWTVNHLEYHYIKLHFNGEKAKLQCKQCHRQYDTPKKLSTHINYMHSQMSFICDYCSKVFNNRSQVKSHIKVHIDNRSYVCDSCGFSCKRSAGLQQHKLRKHATVKVYCKKCQRFFISQAHLDKHTCTDTSRICPICGVRITKQFKRHIEGHSEVNKYKCSKCPVTYKTHQAWKVHMDKHDGVRTKQCEYCPRKFYSSSVLVKHRRVHTGEKPYVCTVCHKGFTGNHNLKVHMKVHGLFLVAKKTKPEEVPLLAALVPKVQDGTD